MCWYVQRQNKLYKSWDDVDRLKWGIRWKDGDESKELSQREIEMRRKELSQEERDEEKWIEQIVQRVINKEMD